MAEFGLALPNTGFDENFSFRDIVNLAKTAERLGYNHVWVFDRLFHKTAPVLEPFTLLSHVASVTSRVKLGTSVAILTYRNPFLLAKTIATLDVLSNGRTILGVSLGRNENEFMSNGVQPSKKVRVFIDSLKIMKALWAGEPVTYEGLYWKAVDAVELPPPVQKPHPPILIGGAAEGALRRAGKHADGWIAGGMNTAEEVRDKYQIVLNSAHESGKLRRPILAKTLYVSVSNQEDSARQYVAECFRRYYGAEVDVSRFAAIGDPVKCANIIRRLIEVGVEMIAIAPLPATQEHVETIWTKVVESLR
ncbi:MAG: LLM class flavin-dependent oxidoreductase [Candidatus Caldarchaeum sp.]